MVSYLDEKTERRKSKALKKEGSEIDVAEGSREGGYC